MKIKGSEIANWEVRRTIFAFLSSLGYFMVENEEPEDSDFEFLFKGKDQIRNPNPCGAPLNRVIFSVQSFKSGVTLFITHNKPVSAGATPFYTLGDEFEAVSPDELCKMLLGR